MNQKIRAGRITSSQCWRVMGSPKVAQTYLTELKYQRKLGRGLNTESSARPTSWGNLVERRVFDLLPIEYRLTSKLTLVHSEIDYWAGSPDGFTDEKVYDIKCPYTLKSFCELSEMTAENLMDEKPEYFWQLVSNAILTGKDKAELIVYCPYIDELQDIRLLANDYEEAWKVFWIANSNDDELPYLPKESSYKNIRILEFNIEPEFKNQLTTKIKTLSSWFTD